VLRALGTKVFVARFRPRGWSFGKLRSCLSDQKIIAAAGPFDVQHSLDFSPSPIEAASARWNGRKFVFTQKNLNEGGRDWVLWIKGAIAHRIVAIAEAVRDKLVTVGVPRRKILVIGSGFERTGEASVTGPFPDGRFILSVGQIERRKRHADAISAFGRLASSDPDLKFLIAGTIIDSVYAEELEQQAKSLGLADRIFFLGIRKDVLALMERASCLLHCAESEAVPWVILEAMSSKLPIVATPVGGVAEMIEDSRSGVLVPVGDDAGFAKAVGSILDNPALAARLTKEAAKTLHERYSAQACGARLGDLYRSLCGNVANERT
jgi:glycosyltransferase involved in cell wall biosynthesis